MNNVYGHDEDLSPKQATIQARCFHPRGVFVEFKKGDMERSIIEHFEERSVKHRDRIAVKTKDQMFTYDALDQTANSIAEAIRSRCGETNEPVALLLEQSGQSIAAILGVLKTGKIYVPLDQAYPQAKLRAILQDCQCQLMLSDTGSLPLAKELTSGLCPLLCLDDINTSLPTQVPRVSVSPDNIAAIFYTSGSTGEPKGVIQTQRNILHRVMTDTNTFHICSDDRLSLLSAATYSVSLRNLFGALLNGATVCPFKIEEEGVGHIAPWLAQEKITIYFSVPTIFRQFTANLTGKEDLSAVRLIYLAGEGSAKRDVELYKKYFSPECIFVNSLASNEAGIIRQYFVDKETGIEGTQVPAGYKVEKKELLLVDDIRQEVGAGEVGEIAVRSCYLSPGYWRQPNLTDRAFWSDPEGGKQRIYFTGDLGRLLPDGCLLYLGRNDVRVKIRGIGVEVGEIERALQEHGALKEAVVIAQDDFHGEKRLVAYVVLAEKLPPTASQLRIFLQQKLPDYMIPSAFAFLESLPVTTNGKIDRQSLPLFECLIVDSGEPPVAPRTLLEQKLADIWSEVLGLEQVRVNDNFFDLGGHSLSASQIVARLQTTFDLDLPLATFLVNPTVAGMAEVIEAIRWTGEAQQDSTDTGEREQGDL